MSDLLEVEGSAGALLRLESPAWAGVQVRVSTREGGCSQPPYASCNVALHVGDSPAAVMANRARLRRFLPAEPLWLQQVHGTTVFHADALESLAERSHHSGVDGVPPGQALHAEMHQALQQPASEADAAVTAQPGQVLAIMTADCLPVVLADPHAGVIAAAHAGWRGLAAGVLENTLQAMIGQGAQMSRILAWIGPAIGPEAFEVGDDVRQAMGYNETQYFFLPGVCSGKWWCDLPALAQARLQAAGVLQIDLSGLCTVQDPRFYSYRRDGETGRFVTLLWLDGC